MRWLYTLILTIFALLIASCGAGPLEQRMYRVCNDEPQADAPIYDPASTVRFYAVERTDNNPFTNAVADLDREDTEINPYLVTRRQGAENASLVLCISKTLTGEAFRCPYTSGAVIGRTGTYAYSLRVAQTGEELVNGEGTLDFGEGDPRDTLCPPGLPSSFFDDGDIIRTPRVNRDPEFLAAVLPFLTGE